MTHLSAIFRSLLSLDLPLSEVISRANRLFSESTPARTMPRWWWAALPGMAWICATPATAGLCW